MLLQRQTGINRKTESAARIRRLEDHIDALGLDPVSFVPLLAPVVGADAAVLVTEWRHFADLDWAEVARVMRGRLVLDGRNFFDPAAIRSAGLVYEGVGRRG